MYATFGELVEDMILKPNEARKQAEFEAVYPQFVDMEQSVSIMEECLEMMEACSDLSLYEAQYECAEALAFEGERWDKFKEGAKKLWLKIIQVIRKIINFIVEVITFPFRLIKGLIEKKKLNDLLNSAKCRLFDKNMKVENWYASEIGGNCAKIQQFSIDVLERTKRDAMFYKQDLHEFNNILFECAKGYTDRAIQRLEKLEVNKRNNDIITFDKSYNNLIENIKNEKGRPHTISGPEAIQNLEVLISITQEIYKVEKSSNDLKPSLIALDKQLKDIISMIEQIKEPFDNMSDNVKFSLNKTLYIIQEGISQLLRLNKEVGTIFLTINHSINKIKEATTHQKDASFFKSINTIDHIGGIPVIANTALLAYATEGKGPGAAIYTSSEIVVLNRQGILPNEFLNKFPNGVIIIETRIKDWKDSKPSWYYWILTHEYGHRVLRNNLLNNAKRGIKRNNGDEKEYYDNEILADDIADNISNISRQEMYNIINDLYDNWENEVDKYTGQKIKFIGKDSMLKELALKRFKINI